MANALMISWSPVSGAIALRWKVSRAPARPASAPRDGHRADGHHLAVDPHAGAGLGVDAERAQSQALPDRRSHTVSPIPMPRPATRITRAVEESRSPANSNIVAV